MSAVNCPIKVVIVPLSWLMSRLLYRAIQLVVVEVSVDFTRHTLLSSANEYEQSKSANEIIVIVTYKLVSAVNCPIKDGIVPLSELL